MAGGLGRRDDVVMKSQVATNTVSGHVFAYPTVVSLGTSGSLLQPLAPAPIAQDASRTSGAGRDPLWAIEYAATA
jgi:hypothetical protein